VKHLPHELCARHPAIDWKGFAALRDVLVHPYFRARDAASLANPGSEVPSLRRAVETKLEKSKDG
jgi:uncharacterized protein with HEPN domain